MIKEYTPMKMTKAMRLLAVAAALCLGLLGCSPKAMEAFAAWQPEILLHPGETWEGKIPGDGKSPSYTVTVNTVPGLEARVEEDRLVLTATRAGEGQLTLAASAKGYHDTTLTLPVRVEPLPMELSWELVEEELAEGEEPAVWADQDRIGATVGETFTLPPNWAPPRWTGTWPPSRWGRSTGKGSSPSPPGPRTTMTRNFPSPSRWSGGGCP